MMYRRVSLAKWEQIRGKMDITFTEAQEQVSDSDTTHRKQ